MKILGVSSGGKNGNNDSMCKEALMGAQEAGAEIEFIRLLELGSLVQIDEPGLSGGFMNPEIAIKIINNMLEKSIKKEKWQDKLSIHVCGAMSRVNNLFENLLNLNASVLSLAFSGNIEKENLKIIPLFICKNMFPYLHVG